VYLLGGYDRHHTSYGDGIAVHDLDELHKAIGNYLVNQKKVLAGKELRFIRKQMNLSQSQLGTLLALSSQQVARWEKGESEISGAAELLVRAFYLQFHGANVNLKELADALEAMDSPINEKSTFESTPDGWKKAA
jgi:DNA-binding transcriptional regulator YiaG